MRYGMNLYFESAAMIPTLVTIGKMLESMSKGRTTDALKGLIWLSPQTAVLYRNEEEREVSIKEVKEGDIFIVRPGGSIPVDKVAGSPVSAATINQSGYLRCCATRVGEDTTLSQIIKTVSDAAAMKAPIYRIADRVSGVFVPAVIAIALLTLAGWLIVGKANTVALDKTGTITEGKPAATDILPCEISDQELLTLAAALESVSEHPLAKAIADKAAGMEIPEADAFRALAGTGVSALLVGEVLKGGSYAADIVVMKKRLSDVSAAIRLSRAAIRNIHENLFCAFCYNYQFMGIE